VLWDAFSHAQPYPGYDAARLAVLRPVRYDVWFVRSATSSGWDLGNVLVPIGLALVVVACATWLWRRTPDAVVAGRSEPVSPGDRSPSVGPTLDASAPQ
jgi:hypothetical protein